MAITEERGLQAYCVFRRTPFDLALPIAVVTDVSVARPLAPVPFAPPHLRGARWHRGQVIPVFCIDPLLQAKGETRPAGPSWVFLAVDGVRAAIEVDRLLGTAIIAAREVRRTAPVPVAVGTVSRGGRELVLLDPVRLLAALATPTTTAFTTAGVPA